MALRAPAKFLQPRCSWSIQKTAMAPRTAAAGSRDVEIMGQNGIQLIRIWLSQWSIFGSAWSPWSGLRGDYDGYVPSTGLITYGTQSTSEIPSAQMQLVYSEDGNGAKNRGSWFEGCRDHGAKWNPANQNMAFPMVDFRIGLESLERVAWRLRRVCPQDRPNHIWHSEHQRNSFSPDAVGLFRRRQWRQEPRQLVRGMP